MRVNALAAPLADFAERAEAAAEEVADLDETAAVGEPVNGLLLCGSPLKPAGYVVPVHAATLTPRLPRITMSSSRLRPRIFVTTSPCTSVSRKSRPWNL